MKNQKNIVAVLVILVVVLIGYWYVTSNKTTQTPLSSTTPTANEGTTPVATSPLTLNLVTQNNSGVSGTATLTENIGKVIVELKTIGDAPNRLTSSEPAHIHSGTCAKMGAVKYPLANVTSNHSVTVVGATLAELKSELPLAINIHKSAEESATSVACVDLAF